MTQAAPAGLTPPEFAHLLADALARHFVSPRDLAHKSKVPFSDVEAWLDGRRLPDPSKFARAVFCLPSLRHLKPLVRAAWDARASRAVLQGGVRVDGVAPPAAAPMPSTFAAAVAYLRDRDDLTQGDLAEILECEPTAVSNWETGQNGVSRELLDKLCDLWPELTYVPAPPVLVELKPAGNVGPRVAAPRPTPREPPEVPPMSQPRPTAPVLQPTPAAQPSPRESMLAVIRAGVALSNASSREDLLAAFDRLLVAATTAGLSVADVRQVVAEVAPK